VLTVGELYGREATESRHEGAVRRLGARAIPVPGSREVAILDAIPADNVHCTNVTSPVSRKAPTPRHRQVAGEPCELFTDQRKEDNNKN